MKGDRIIVAETTLGNVENVFPVYKPRTNPDGTNIMGYDGTVVLERAGGVKTGSTGTIQGEAVPVHKSQLFHLQNQPATLGGTQDFALVYPVYFDQYQLVGWISGDHIRIVGGGTPEKPKKK